MTELEIVLHQRIISFRSGRIDRRGIIVKVPAAVDGRAQTTSAQINPDEIKPIENLLFRRCLVGYD